MTEWTDHRVPLSPCPHCGRAVDAASIDDGSGEPPGPGDVSICLGCGKIMLFGPAPALELRKLTDPETVRLMLSPEWASVLRMQRAVCVSIARRAGLRPRAKKGPRPR
jgi:hypothetical protein